MFLTIEPVSECMSVVRVADLQHLFSLNYDLFCGSPAAALGLH